MDNTLNKEKYNKTRNTCSMARLNNQLRQN